MIPRLAVAAPSLPPLVLLALAGVGLQVAAQLAVVAGVEDILWVVPSEDRPLIPPGGRSARDVADVGRAPAAPPDRDPDEDPAHGQTRPPNRRRASSAAASARSSASGGTRPPAFRRRAI